MSREPGEAPGLEWKERSKDGARIPRWRARKKAVTLGYRPSVIQLDIDPNDRAALAERCRAEWTKMEAWLANERPAPIFDGTLASLIGAMQSRRTRNCDTGHSGLTTNS
jgi:hypothetical protein